MCARVVGKNILEELKNHDWYEMVHYSNTMEGHDSPEMDIATINALSDLGMLRSKRLTLDLVKALHRAVTVHQKTMPEIGRGRFRTELKVDVKVGNHYPPRHYAVDILMEDWINRFGNRSPKENHIEFERIHPFADGNGRVGRIILWWQQLMEDEELFVISDDNIDEYYGWFKDMK